MTELLTMGDVAKFVGVHKMTIYRMEKTGKLAGIGVTPRRLRHGTKERQFTREQAEAIKRYREEVDGPDSDGSS